MHGKMDHEVVTPRPQGRDQPQLGRALTPESLALPVAVDQVQSATAPDGLPASAPYPHRPAHPPSHAGAWCLSAEITGAASSTSPWWRSLITSARRRPAAEKACLGHGDILPERGRPGLSHHMQFAFLLLDLIELFPETCRP
jgi:hypothetical protein